MILKERIERTRKLYEAGLGYGLPIFFNEYSPTLQYPAGSLIRYKHPKTGELIDGCIETITMMNNNDIWFITNINDDHITDADIISVYHVNY